MPTAKKTDAKPAKKRTPKKAPAKPAAKVDFQFHTVTDEESMPDGTLLCSFTIPGRAATKKTSQRIICRGRRGGHTLLPSEQFVAYEEHCEKHVKAAWADLGRPPMNFGVAVEMKVTLNTWTVGDVTGYAQAIGDIIEKFGVISNDLWINWMPDGHAIQHPDTENPRVELRIFRYRHPKETFRASQEELETKRIERRNLKADKANAQG